MSSDDAAPLLTLWKPLFALPGEELCEKAPEEAEIEPAAAVDKVGLALVTGIKLLIACAPPTTFSPSSTRISKNNIKYYTALIKWIKFNWNCYEEDVSLLLNFLPFTNFLLYFLIRDWNFSLNFITYFTFFHIKDKENY